VNGGKIERKVAAEGEERWNNVEIKKGNLVSKFENGEREREK